MFAEHQYVLKAPVETLDKSAEKYSFVSLVYGKYSEEVSVYGVEENSRVINNINFRKIRTRSSYQALMLTNSV